MRADEATELFFVFHTGSGVNNGVSAPSRQGPGLHLHYLNAAADHVATLPKTEQIYDMNIMNVH